MAIPDLKPEEIEENLKKFYRDAEVSMEAGEVAYVFIIKGYVIRETGKKCTVGLLIEGKKAYVMIERSFEEIKRYLTGNEGRREISGRTWIIVPEKYFWDLRRPPYWFMERNLTSFLGNRWE